LIGLLLGDVFAERNKPTHNTRLNFEQSQSEHESYLLFLYSLFKNLVATAQKSTKRNPHSVTPYSAERGARSAERGARSL